MSMQTLLQRVRLVADESIRIDPVAEVRLHIIHGG